MAPRDRMPSLEDIVNVEDEIPSDTEEEFDPDNLPFEVALETLQNMIPLVNDPSVRIRNPLEVARKVAHMAYFGGFEDLLVITDMNVPFKTFTLNRERLTRACEIVSRSPEFKVHPTEGHIPKVFDAQYGGMSIGPNSYSTQLEVAMKADLTKQKLLRMAEEAASILEPKIGTMEMFMYLEQERVPVMVVSSDPLGDFYKPVFNAKGLKSNHVHLLFDHFQYDELGNVTGRCGSWQQVERGLHNGKEPFDYFADLADKTHLMVLTNDVGLARICHLMVVDDPEMVLKIGYLNDQVEERLADFMEVFDIVLINNESMDLPCQFLAAVEAFEYEDNGVPED